LPAGVNRAASPLWLTVLNHLGGAFLLLPLVWDVPTPTARQLGVLFLFGAVQMAFPYWLVARGLRAVSPQEAARSCCWSRFLNPYGCFSVAGERPAPVTLTGGAFIVGGAGVAVTGRSGTVRPASPKKMIGLHWREVWILQPVDKACQWQPAASAHSATTGKKHKLPVLHVLQG